MKKFSSGRALLLSVLSMVICVSMLIRMVYGLRNGKCQHN